MKFYSFVLCVVILCIPLKAFCEDQEKAKEHYLKGKALVDEGAYEKAIIELNASYELNQVPVVLYNIAVCYDELKKFGQAAKFYRKFLLEAKDATEEMKKSVSDRLKEINKFLGILELKVNEEGADVTIDGELVGKTPLGNTILETGQHKIVVSKQGFPEVKKNITTVSGQTVTLNIVLQKEEKVEKTTEPPKAEEKVTKEQVPKKVRKKIGTTALWSVIGLTGAFTLTAIVTGALSLQKSSEVESMYENEDWKPVYDEGKHLAIATDVMIGFAAASAATAVVLVFFTDFHKEKQAAFIAPSASGEAFFITCGVGF